MVMPRYFFHLQFGQRVVPDEEGVELPSRTAARNEALAVVRDLANPEVGGSRLWASWFLEVADDRGEFFRAPIGHPALEVVTPGRPDYGAEDPQLESIHRAATASLRDRAAGRSRSAELVRQMSARRERTAQLLKANERLRQELSSLCLASQNIRIRTSRLV